MELARGIVRDERPWAITLAMFARRGTTGQVTLAAFDGKRYSIAFDRGVIVAARSPSIADSVGRVALTTRAASSEQVAELTRQHHIAPHLDEIEILAEIAKLSLTQIQRLRWEVISRRAARSFSVDLGEWLLEDRICLPVSGCEVDTRAVTYQGLRLHAAEERMRRQLRALGEVYQLEQHAGPELHRFGFTDDEWPLMAALRTASSLPELEVRLREVDPRAMHAAVYALTVFGVATSPAIGRISTPPSIARLGSQDHLGPVIARLGTPSDIPVPSVARLGTAPEVSPRLGTAPEVSARLHDISSRAADRLVSAPQGSQPLPTISRTMTPVGRFGPPPGVPAMPRTKTNPEIAAEAVERAMRALEQDKPEGAVLELKKAVELVPNDPDYTALLGWALFCAADDKRAAAAIARKSLESALTKSANPHIARFYLGRIERILGRHREALGHFHAVLLLQPNHREASAEIRILQARMKST